MERIKTICPRCFKIFDVVEDLDKVECFSCSYIYDLPKLIPQIEDDCMKGK